MSSFQRLTKHPKDEHWETAWWLDDYFGNHRYGVQFPSTNETFREDSYAWETKPSESLEDFQAFEPSLEKPVECESQEVRPLANTTPRDELREKIRHYQYRGTVQGIELNEEHVDYIEQLINAEVCQALERVKEQEIPGNGGGSLDYAHGFQAALDQVVDVITQELKRYGAKEENTNE